MLNPEAKSNIFLGFDLGSISLNTVVIDSKENILDNYYDYCHGRPFHVLRNRLDFLMQRYKTKNICLIATTGTGGKLAAELTGGNFVNEIIAQSKSVSRLFPEVRTIIEMGGEDSKLIFMENGHENGHSSLSDFAMNSICAAGTGSFLDQQAKRIGVSIEEEFGTLALKSENPPHIAGRCSVFAKSDMIHLQQIATPVHDIVAGLCFAVARNFKSNLAKGRDIATPAIFQGGVAANRGVVHAFKQILHISNEQLIVPPYHASMGALGAVFYAMEHTVQGFQFKGIENLDRYLETCGDAGEALPSLTESAAAIVKSTSVIPETGEKYPVYLGVDVGSLSTNIVLIDDDNRVIARRYLPTASRPLDAIRKGLSEIYDEVGAKVDVKAAGTTGSGRYLTGDFIGADEIRNEITAQATAAIAFDPEVDTIFEIGGQDSKFISIDQGVVVDFEMNKVCAAGTGSFLEEQAEKLDINIVDEFGQLALKARNPVSLGCRCTVFIESDLNANQQRGESNENLVGGLAYSIVNNYLQKVVGNKRIGKRIFFQGGVANNKGVVAAFEQVTGKHITIPPNFDVTGAIGMAMLAKEKVKNNGTTCFKGFNIRNTPFSLDKFTCRECTNHCEIRTVQIHGESRPLFYGGRCEKYEVDSRKKTNNDIPNLFAEREKLLLGDFSEENHPGKVTIGIPRELSVYYQEFPFWRTFFGQLGFRIVLSEHSNRKLVTRSLEMLTSETCFPVEVMHGHILDLLDKQVDHIFIPFVINNTASEDNPTSNCNCPWIQSYPFMVRAALANHPGKEKLLIPALHPRYFNRVFVREMAEFMGKQFQISEVKVKKALHMARDAQLNFEKALIVSGKEVLDNLASDRDAMVILGRPYNTGDPELNLRLIDKLIGMNVLPIPLDFLPLNQENVFDEFPAMYWPNGRKILCASRIIARDKRLNGLYISNFRCGPDSFLLHFVTEIVRSKPILQIEIDEHSADAGLVTRLEAFLDSIRKNNYATLECSGNQIGNFKMATPAEGRVLYWPYMHDGSYIVAAAARSCGIDSCSLPMQTREDLELGRKYTSSRECFPMICTTGSFIRKLREPGIDDNKVSFFMPDHNGPCRFGQYNQLQKIIFNRLGKTNVKIVSPTNDGSYSDITPGNSNRFRFNAWKGFVAYDLIRKLQQQYRPYEKKQGETNRVYKESLNRIITSIENNATGLTDALEESKISFRAIELTGEARKPVVAIVGEIFMRDNSFCNGNLVSRLEALGAETWMAPFSEWFVYSTYRYMRDSIWKGDHRGYLKSKIQQFSQHISYSKLFQIMEELIDTEKDIQLDDMLSLTSPYIHRHYDGDPVIAVGTASALARKGVSGICNILPFTCMPGTLICSVSDVFRRNHHNIPWMDYAYDGQNDASLETRLQAFLYQVRQFSSKSANSKSPVTAWETALNH